MSGTVTFPIRNGTGMAWRNVRENTKIISKWCWSAWKVALFHLLQNCFNNPKSWWLTRFQEVVQEGKRSIILANELISFWEYLRVLNTNTNFVCKTVNCIGRTQFLTFILIYYNWMLLNTPFFIRSDSLLLFKWNSSPLVAYTWNQTRICILGAHLMGIWSVGQNKI